MTVPSQNSNELNHVTHPLRSDLACNSRDPNLFHKLVNRLIPFHTDCPNFLVRNRRKEGGPNGEERFMTEEPAGKAHSSPLQRWYGTVWFLHGGCSAFQMEHSNTYLVNCLLLQNHHSQWMNKNQPKKPQCKIKPGMKEEGGEHQCSAKRRSLGLVNFVTTLA